MPRPFKAVYKLHFSACCEALRPAKSNSLTDSLRSLLGLELYVRVIGFLVDRHEWPHRYA